MFAATLGHDFLGEAGEKVATVFAAVVLPLTGGTSIFVGKTSVIAKELRLTSISSYK